MQWTPGRNAGFTTADRPWLPIPPTARTRNVATMSSDPKSILSFFKRAMRLRRESPALLDGDYQALGDDPRIFAYQRRTADQTMIVLLNMSGSRSTPRLDPMRWGGREQLKLRISNVPRPAGEVVNARWFSLAPYEAAVFEVKPRTGR